MDCRIKSGNDSQRMPLELQAFAAPAPRSMQKIPGIGNEPNDGAEHGCDQHVAWVFIELIHVPDYAGRGGRDQLAIDSKWPAAHAIGKTEDNLF